MLAPAIGTRAACTDRGCRATVTGGPGRRARRACRRDRAQPRALSLAERAAILAALHAERFADLAPAEVWAILLDEGTYLGSLSTFYRLLRQAARPGPAGAGHPPRRGSPS